MKTKFFSLVACLAVVSMLFVGCSNPNKIEGNDPNEKPPVLGPMGGASPTTPPAEGSTAPAPAPAEGTPAPAPAEGTPAPAPAEGTPAPAPAEGTPAPAENK